MYIYSMGNFFQIVYWCLPIIPQIMVVFAMIKILKSIIYKYEIDQTIRIANERNLLSYKMINFLINLGMG